MRPEMNGYWVTGKNITLNHATGGFRGKVVGRSPSWWPSQNGQKQPIGYRELSIGNKSKTKFKAAMKTCCNKPITKIRIYQGGTPAQARKQRCRCRIYLIEIDQFI